MKPLKSLTKQLLLFFIILTISSLGTVLLAQTAAPEKTSLGSEFKFVFLQNRILSEKNENDPSLDPDAEERTHMNDIHSQMTLWIYVTNQEDVGADVHFQINEESQTVYFDHTYMAAPSNGDKTWKLWIDAGETEAIEVKVDHYSDIRNAQMMYSEVIQNKMITVSTPTTITNEGSTRSALLAVYSESRQTQSRDAALILPVQSLGNRYIAVTGNRLYDDANYPKDEYQTTIGNSGGPSEIAILAVEDIRVVISVPEYVDDLDVNNDPNKFESAMDLKDVGNDDDEFSIYLRAGEAVQLQSDFYDLTGTSIEANLWTGALANIENEAEVLDAPGKCAVFSGNMAGHVVYEPGEKDNAFDHIYEQMYPVETWGCEYIAVNTTNVDHTPNTNVLTTDKKLDVYKIIAAGDNTEITLLEFGAAGTDIDDPIALNKGEYLVVTRDLIRDKVEVVRSNWDGVLDVTNTLVLDDVSFGNFPEYHFRVQSTRPIIVAQFTVSAKAQLVNDDYQDPSMVLLSPTDQTLEKLSFSTMPFISPTGASCTNSQTQTDYVIILTADNPADLLLDGAIPLVWKPVDNTSWWYTIQNITNTTTDPKIHSLTYKATAPSPKKGFIAYRYGMNCKEAYFYAAGIRAEIRGVDPKKTTECIEPGDPSSALDGDYLNTLGILEAEGGPTPTWAYSWSVRSVPSGAQLSDVQLEDDDKATAKFSSSTLFKAVGTYFFDCVISKPGTCDLTYTVEVVVPSCCDNREEQEGYVHIKKDHIIDTETSWPDRMFIDDGVTVTLSPEAALTINNSDVVFGQCARILVEPGATIRANNSVFRPCNPEMPWDGIYFQSDAQLVANNNSLFNECTFKYAVNAINIENGESVGIHNNLFLNNYTGVNIQGQPVGTSLYSSYYKQISGNKFIVDNNVFNINVPCALDNGEAIESLEHYGIKAVNVWFLESISNNEFNNTATYITQVIPTFSVQNRLFVGILLNSSYAKISQNSFSEMYHGVQADNCRSNIIGNTFELTDMVEDKAQVDVRNSIEEVDIRSNEFTCWGDLMDYFETSAECAIYLSDCENVAVVGNEITGFNIGILSVELRNSLIANNRIDKAVEFGIYVKGILGESGEEGMSINCNEIHMDFNRLDKPSVGICGDNITGTSKIMSNCIFNCMVSVLIKRPSWETSEAAPEIQNNFLYNYDWAGIYFDQAANTASSNRDNVRDNTYYANSDAYDIYSNHSSNIHVKNSFGLGTVSAQVLINGTGNAKFSTASCGAQIFRLGIPTDKTNDFLSLMHNSTYTDYKCDDDYSTVLANTTEGNWLSRITELSTSQLEGMPFGEGEYALMLSETARHDMVAEAARVYDASQGSDLSELAKIRLSFKYHLNMRNFEKASEVLVAAARKPELERWARLNTIRIKYIQSGFNKSAITKTDRETLSELAQTLDYVGSGATTFLNALSQKARLKYIETAEIEQPESFGRMSTVSNRIEVYPNPSKTVVDIQFSFESSEVAEMTIVDIYGKEVGWMKPSYISGTINVDVSEWESGFYFVNVTLENGELHSQKFVKI